MRYSQSDFNDLFIPVHKAKSDIPIKDQYHYFSIYPEFQKTIEGLDHDCMLKYIVFMYDQYSPLKAINDILTRKAQAATLAGFQEEKTGAWSDVIMKMFYCAIPDFTSMVIRYARLQQSPAWLTLVAYEEKLFKSLRQLVDESSDNEKTKDQLAAINTMRNDIAILKKEIANDDNTRQLYVDISNHVDAEIAKIRVEDIAYAMATKENPLSKYNPYGTDKRKKSHKSDF